MDSGKLGQAAWVVSLQGPPIGEEQYRFVTQANDWRLSLHPS